MVKQRIWLIAGIVIIIVAGVTAYMMMYAADGEAKEETDVKVWLSSADGLFTLDPQEDVVFGQAGSTSPDMRTFLLDDAVTYQPYFGMGSSLEESTVYNLMRMSENHRESVMKVLFDPKEGLGWNLMRITLGTSDFTGREWYSYNDNPPGGSDPEMTHFSIQKDLDYHIIPIIKQALSYNPEMKIIASAWSVPAWMKDSGRLDGGPAKSGKMKSEYLPALALYYRKTIEAYAEQGIPIYAISLHNEPGIHVDYPMTEFSLSQQIELLKQLKQEFSSTEHGEIIDTEVWVNEFNIYDWEQQNKRIYDDPEAYALSDGTAFHDYWGHLSSMSDAHEAHPDKPIYMTERSVWGTKGADRIIQYFRNYARSYNAWVTLLDNQGQPNVSSTGAGRTLVTIDSKDPDQYAINFEAYMMGHFSKYLERGALRLDSNYYDDNYDTHISQMNGEEEVRPELSNIAFQNPDGTIVMIVVNNSSMAQDFRLLYKDKEFSATLPAKSLATYQWSAWPDGDQTQERVKTPVIAPVGGRVFGVQSVIITTSTEEAQIRYTLDGSIPDGNSPLYSGPIPLEGTNETVVVKAIAFKEGALDSVLKSAAYEFVIPSIIRDRLKRKLIWTLMTVRPSLVRKADSISAGLIPVIGWIIRWRSRRVDYTRSPIGLPDRTLKEPLNSEHRIQRLCQPACRARGIGRNGARWRASRSHWRREASCCGSTSTVPVSI
ncbi:O-glycosyl hydrolase family 30 [Paenibacillus sp. JCM 10914]|nr:chitobiase/beta-hexosaminidase C-terminal domain-containing protein [Paenibacillus sp. JCM 10914]GAE07091.1 O-glycosyl hydrolase family 30 [Paenibacillus sp. JCM 10914]